MTVTELRDAVARIAPDPALPQLRRLLDAEAMAPILGRHLADTEPAVRIAYASYRPQKSLLVQYEVGTERGAYTAVAVAEADADLARVAADPEHATLAASADACSPVRPSLRYEPELNVLIHWFPLDLGLPALAEPPERLRELIAAAGVDVGSETRPELVGYKPRRRAVFRLGHHFVKLYGTQELFARSVHNLRAANTLPIRTARLEAALPELRIQVQSLLEGRQPDGPDAAAAEAGPLLTILHGARLEGLRAAPREYWLRNARRSARVVEAVVPPLAPRLEALLAALEVATRSAALVPCHVDFFFRQIVENGAYGLVDFDRLSLAEPALDLATYVADVVAGPEDLERAAALLDVLCSAYGSRPTGTGWYLAVVLLRRARTPFGHLVPGWPDEVERRVAAAEAALARAGTSEW